MISLPGLLLCTGRFEDARQVLKSFASAMKDGVLPNDLGAGSYNTVDASLWFVRAVGSYFEYSKDLEFVGAALAQAAGGISSLFSAGRGLWRGRGWSYRIRARAHLDGCAPGWPAGDAAGRKMLRDKCPLVFCLERYAEALRGFRQVPDPGFAELAERVRQSYQRFWNSETGCLYDVIDHEDASIRPNQIIAAGIPDLLPQVMRKSILDVVTRELLTPFGLRTLSPRDPRYAGRYEGDPRRRDGAYHQGTVWPWLMGPYIDALLSVKGRSGPILAEARELLRPLITMHAGGINTIPEVFDGDCPQRPGGCISQAWSVAEVLRAWERALSAWDHDNAWLSDLLAIEKQSLYMNKIVCNLLDYSRPLNPDIDGFMLANDYQ